MLSCRGRYLPIIHWPIIGLTRIPMNDGWFQDSDEAGTVQCHAGSPSRNWVYEAPSLATILEGPNSKGFRDCIVIFFVCLICLLYRM